MSATLKTRDAPSEAAAPPALPRAVHRLRLLVISVALTAAVFAQSAGAVVPDTKLDLVVNPLRFLSRATTLWDPRGAAGQLQNQAYGYLFPMGPFFALGKLIALPAWVIQRSWQSALLVAAFLGMVRLSRLLGVGPFWPRVAAGLAYALAPRILAELGSISSELMPVAALPWVLVPLVGAASCGSPRRAAARSGVALLFAGGVNAAATLAILPVPALWLLTRERGPRRRALIRWWTLAVLCACAWWLAPLFLLGKYSPPFLDWIESSQVTTGVTSLIASLRGADHWQAYLGPSTWPAGWIIAVAPAAIAATAIIAAAGIAGLSRSDLPHPLFLRGTLVVGLLIVTAGYTAKVGPPFASPVRALLDGPLNAFRNIHKFDPLIRLPMAIGVGHLLNRARVPDRLVVRRRRKTLELRTQPLAVVVVLAIAAVGVTPLISDRLMPQPRVMADAPWWRAAGSWLGSHAAAGRALVVPGAARPVYVWGSTVDDALQPVATGPWTVRDGVPLAQAGYVRLLDDISQRFAAGRNDPVLPVLLARSGIRYVVVRNDLDTDRSGAVGLPFIHATIDTTPGFAQVAAFGALPSPKPDPRQIVDLGATIARPLVQVYEVVNWSGEVSLLPATDVVDATGSADELGALLAAGLTPDTPVLFGNDGAQLAPSRAQQITTDGIRRREARFGLTASYSATMTADEPYTWRRAAHDYLPADAGPLSTVSYRGMANVQASSSGADVNALFNLGAAHGAWAAVDGDPSTSWESGASTGAVGQWLKVTLDRAVQTSTIQVAFTAGLGGYPSRVRLTTETGSQDADVSPGPFPQDLRMPAGPTRTLQITVLAAPPAAHTVGISTLQIPGVFPTRTLVVPTSGLPEMLTFEAEPGFRSSCLTVRGRAACDPSFAAAGEEDGTIDRTFTLSGARQYAIVAQVRARPGAALDRFLDAGVPIRAKASSVDDPDPRERPGAAVDGDPETSWVARVGDEHPSLTLVWTQFRKITSLHLIVDRGAPIARPKKIRVSARGHSWTLPVPADGAVRLPRAVVANALQITVLEADLRLTSSSATGRSHLLPPGISEIAINGVAMPPRFGTLTLGCSDGLVASVNGELIPLQGTVARSALLAGDTFTVTPCGATPAELRAGANRVRLMSSSLVDPESMTLTTPDVMPIANGGGDVATPLTWGATERTVRISAATQSLLAVRENANAGWRATLHGQRLVPVRLDGWQQGWVVPAGSAGIVKLSYTPQATFDWSILGGAILALVLVVFALMRARDRGWSAIGERSVRRGWPAIVAVAAFLLAGLAGLLIAIGVSAVGQFWSLWRGKPLPWWLGGVLVGLAGCAEALAPIGSPHPYAGSPVVQALCVAAVCVLITGCVPDRLHAREKRRKSGRSKKYQESAPSNVAEAAVSRKYSG